MNKPHLRSAYILISFIMFMPVLFWPVPLLLYDYPVVTATNILKPTWFLSISLLLMTVVSIDSILYGIKSRTQAIFAMLWISTLAMISIIALQNNNHSWLLAVLFLTHSFRSGYRLFFIQKKVPVWLLGLAWGRDITTSLTIFFWLLIFPNFWGLIAIPV